jgi:hypothetical protein
LQRHFRFIELEDWKMAEIIGFLPTLLFMALFMFLIGLADWLFHLHKFISAFVLAGIGIAAIFYIATTIIAILHVDAPFRTPGSKALPFYHTLIKYIKRFVALLLGWRMSGRKAAKQDHSFYKREQMAIQRQPYLEANTLLWAVKSVDVTPHSRNVFKTLLEELMELPAEQLLHPAMADAPWVPIFTLLCEPYLGRRKRTDYSDEELNSKEVTFLLRSIAMVGYIEEDGGASREILSSLVIPFSTAEAGATREALTAYAIIALVKSGHVGNPCYSISHIIANIHTLPMTFLRLSLMLLHDIQSKNPGDFKDPFHSSAIQRAIAEYCDVDPHAMNATPLVPSETLQLLLRMLATDLSNRAAFIEDPLKAYLHAYEEAQRDGLLGEAARGAHRAIRRQYLFRLNQIHWSLEQLVESEPVLIPIYAMTSLTPGYARVSAIRDMFVVVLSKSFKIKMLGLPAHTRMNIGLVVFCHLPSMPSRPEMVGIGELLGLFANACDKMLHDIAFSLDDRISFITVYCRALGDLRLSGEVPADMLGSVRNPAVILGIWAVHFLRFDPPGLSRFPPELWQDLIWSKVAEWAFCSGRTGLWNLESTAFIELTRGALAYGSPRTQAKYLTMLAGLLRHGVSVTLTSNTANTSLSSGNIIVTDRYGHKHSYNCCTYATNLDRMKSVRVPPKFSKNQPWEKYFAFLAIP